jgi:Arc/MetJ-type ribon-helix-helix transcriptional regulator
MQIVTVNLTKRQLQGLQTLEDRGYFPSRSEAIRQAIEYLLILKLDEMKAYNPDANEEPAKVVPHGPARFDMRNPGTALTAELQAKLRKEFGITG